MAKKRRKDRDEELALFARYKADPSRELRNVIIERFLELVRRIACEIKAGLPKHVDVEELASAGVDGLMFAIERFDPERGNRFATFAGWRIRGSIIDWLRRVDRLPRSARERRAAVEQTAADLSQRFSRPPTVAEMAAELDLSIDETLRRWSEAAEREPAYLHCVVSTRFDVTRRLGELLTDRSAEDPADRMQRADLIRLVVKGLSKRDRLILLMYYVDGMTMREIGETLGISESRVSQLRDGICHFVRTRLDGRQDEFRIGPPPPGGRRRLGHESERSDQ